jgi:hypothetical protein
VLDDRLVPKVLEIVQKYGKIVGFVVPTSQTYDPATGTNTVTTPVTYNKKVTPPQNYSSRLIDGQNILAGDCQIFLPASGLTFAPVAGMKVTIASQTWAIVNAGPIYTGESIALYELQLRK